MVLLFKERRITEIMTKQILLISENTEFSANKNILTEVLVACKLLKPNHYPLLSTQNFYYLFNVLY